MKKRILAVAFLSSMVMLWFAGCSPNSTAEKLSDGTAGDMAMEVTQMSDEGSAGLTKMTASAEAMEAIDTIILTNQVILQPWTYDPSSMWWTRSFEDSLSVGLAFTRIDSLQFTDAASQSLAKMPAWVTSAGWTHIRHKSCHGLINSFNSRFAMNVVVAKSTDTEATWNGTITGVWNGSALSNTTVTNVVRKFAGQVGSIHWWRFPASGTIYIDNPLRTWTVTFTGDGGATAVVTRKSDNKQKTFTITLTTGKENE